MYNDFIVKFSIFCKQSTCRGGFSLPLNVDVVVDVDVDVDAG